MLAIAVKVNTAPATDVHTTLCSSMLHLRWKYMALVPLWVPLISPSIPFQCSVWGAQWPDWGGTQKAFERLCPLCMLWLTTYVFSPYLIESVWVHRIWLLQERKTLFHSFFQLVFCQIFFSIFKIVNFVFNISKTIGINASLWCPRVKEKVIFKGYCFETSHRGTLL